MESQRRREEKKRRKIFEEITAENSPILIKTISKSSTNFKLDKYKEIQTFTQHSQSVEIPRQNLGSRKRKNVHHV